MRTLVASSTVRMKFLHRSAPQVPDLRNFGLHRCSISLIDNRQQGKLLLSLLDAVYPSLISDSSSYSPIIVYQSNSLMRVFLNPQSSQSYFCSDP
ncbi:MAG: hypothetical protein KC592_17070 [Nitrospira sp.]|nr:hypothetical protein [Nitrospira sp.]